MKTKVLVLVLAVAGIFFASCDDYDGIRVNREIEAAFRSRYPDATRVEWDFEQGYYVASFRQFRLETAAWYTNNGIWRMTETDIRYEDLPQAVRDAFQRSEYANWRIEDVDMLEYSDRETVYIIEVEQRNAEYDLYFTPDGILVKAVSRDDNGNGPGNGNDNGSGQGNDNGQGNDDGNGQGNGNDNGNEHTPVEIIPAIKEWIAQHYPQARILDIENEHSRIEVDVVDGYTPREVVFTQLAEWIHTQTEDVRKADVPAVVLNALQASEYGSWRIDEIDHFLTPTVEYYMFELESSGDREVNLRIDINGNRL